MAHVADMEEAAMTRLWLWLRGLFWRGDVSMEVIRAYQRREDRQGWVEAPRWRSPREIAAMREEA